MLLKFTVENYKSIKDKVEFNFSNAKNDGFPVNVICGSPASGKSNFVDALGFMVNCITHYNQPMVSNEDYLSKDSPKNMPFMFFDKEHEFENEVSSFNVLFTMPNHALEILKDLENNPFNMCEKDTRIYEYGFKVAPDRIVSEWLYYYDADDSKRLLKKNRHTIFIREYGKRTIFSDDVIEDMFRRLFHRCRGNVARDEDARKTDGSLILRLGALMRCEFMEYIYNFFLGICVNKINDYIVYAAISTIIPRYLNSNPERVTTFTTLLRDITSDNTIAGITLNTTCGENHIKISHFIMDNPSKTYSIPIEIESDSIKKCLYIIYSMEHYYDKSAVFVIDDIDKYLDANSVRFICEYFKQTATNQSNAQLICTTANENIAAENTNRPSSICKVCSSSICEVRKGSIIHIHKDANGKTVSN